METHDRVYIDGAWRTPSVGDVIKVVNPATEDVVATVPAAGADDVDRAVTAARRALPDWAALSPEQRVPYLERVRDTLLSRRDRIATTVATELGAPIGFAQLVHAGLPILVSASYVDILKSFEFTEKVGNSVVHLEPVGVVAAITPWNYPLHQMVAKVVPAIAAGCTVVLKPAQDTPLVSLLLAEAIDEAGLPPGVFNLLTGTGRTIGNALAAHPGVDMISFTGSTQVGRQIAIAAAGAFKRCALELGGKSANVILPDADLDRAVAVGAANVWSNSGQTCTAWTRMLVHRDQYDDAVERAVASANAAVLGDPMSQDTRVGPVVSAGQRDQIRDYIATGVRDGARLAAGGAETPDGLPTGYYVRPTVFADVQPDATIAQEEIFGPVLSIIRYDNDDEAVAIANNSVYGLAGAVWGEEEHAVAIARRIHTGQVDINGGRFNPQAPFGGVKHSGVGRELGRHGLEEFLEPKSLQF